MPTLISFTRSLFWTFGIIEILYGAYFFLGSPWSSGKPLSTSVATAFVTLNIGLGVFSCLAARAWRRQSRFARVMVAVCSLIYLPLFPFGTAAGAVGLYWCGSKKNTRDGVFAG